MSVSVADRGDSRLSMKKEKQVMVSRKLNSDKNLVFRGKHEKESQLGSMASMASQLTEIDSVNESQRKLEEQRKKDISKDTDEDDEVTFLEKSPLRRHYKYPSTKYANVRRSDMGDVIPRSLVGRSQDYERVEG